MTIKKSRLRILITIIFLTSIALILPTSVTAYDYEHLTSYPDDGIEHLTYPDDGIYTDDFTSDNPNIISTDCILKNGTITLKEHPQGLVFDFKQGAHKEGGTHQAFKYTAPFFSTNIFHSPDLLRIPFRKEEFHPWFDYPRIENPNETLEDYRYASTESTPLRSFVIHLFKFKMDSDSVGELEINWLGKIENAKQIKMYIWQYYGENKILHTWKFLRGSSISGKDILLSNRISEEEAKLSLMKDNVINICVVVTSNATSYPQDTLFTDYVNVTSIFEKGYESVPGVVITNQSIEPKTISNVRDFYWEMLTWKDSTRSDATVNYSLLYENKGEFTLVEENYLKGNNIGFTNPPIDLTNVPYDKLRIKATLTSYNPRVTPKLFHWTLTWQKNYSKWQDLFTQDYRVETKNRVSFENGEITIKPVSGDWPMFGQNAQNTRSSETKGAKKNKLKWYSDNEKVMNMEEIYNPVINEEYLYFCSKYKIESESLYGLIRFEDIFVMKGFFDTSNIANYSSFNIDNKKIVSTPVITDDYIIIATGEEHKGGTENYVYALDKSDPSKDPVWTFFYNDNICYSASPTVANGKVVITSWSGDPGLFPSYTNNKVIAIKLDSKNDLSRDDALWEFDLPASSFSTPAFYEDIVIVGCNNRIGNNVFALDADTGSSIWNASVGGIGKASPVIYDEKVFIVSEVRKLTGITTKVTAFHLNNGTQLWEFTLSHVVLPLNVIDDLLRSPLADCTPTVYNDVLYAVSPKGKLYALNCHNGSEVWSNPTEVYPRGLFGLHDFLTSSPAFADNKIYIGNPIGVLYVVEASNGDSWESSTYDHASIITSPIVSNGLVFFSDKEMLFYCIGEYEAPTEDLDGSIVSNSIKLPKGYWWDKFYADYNDSQSGSNILFNLLDKDKNILKELQNGTGITSGIAYTDSTIRLQAVLSANNITQLPRLFSWNVTFTTDDQPPYLDRDTLTPNLTGWIRKIPSEFTIKVIDNLTGLQIKSAQYTLEYLDNNGTHTKTMNASCTGENGTTEWQLITANITKLTFYQNITGLTSINISINDLAGNKALLFTELKLDQNKPRSYIINETIKESYNSEYEHIRISAKAEDPGISGKNSSEILKVGLYYRYATTPDFSGDWILFEEKNGTSPTWNFTVKDGGYYELCTIAEDNAHNVEDEKEEGDVSFIYDPNPPTIPEFTDPLWFNTTPRFSIKFEDDFLLDTIEYRPNFETEWEIIESDINEMAFNSPWTLLQRYWDQMEEGEEYYLFFRANDSLGNIKIIENQNEALTIIKDISAPNIDIEIPDLEAEGIWDDTFDISAYADDRNGSGIKSVELFYRYSEDNKNWSNWDEYKDELTSAPFEWEFKAEEGNGYYEVYISGEDKAGNVAVSDVIPFIINIFPLIFVVAMVILVVALLIITTALFVLWRKKKE